MGAQQDWEEYKLIQDKFDKIGDFRFRVKTWSVTLLGTFLFAGAAANVEPLLYFLFLVPCCCFWLLEEYQKIIQQALGAQLEEVALRMQRRRMVKDPAGLRAVLASRQSKRPRTIQDQIRQRLRMLQSTRRRRVLRWMVLWSDELFYLSQILIVIAVVAAAYLREPSVGKTIVATTQPLPLQIASPVQVSVPHVLEVNAPGGVTVTVPKTLKVAAEGPVELRHPTTLRVEPLPSTVRIPTTIPVELRLRFPTTKDRP